MSCNRIENPFNRRHFLNSAGAGFGAVALSALTQEPLLARVSRNPTLPKIPHNWGKAKNVIFLFMCGGASHLETFDHKPVLKKYAGKKALPDMLKDPDFATLQGDEKEDAKKDLTLGKSVNLEEEPNEIARTLSKARKHGVGGELICSVF